MNNVQQTSSRPTVDHQTGRCVPTFVGSLSTRGLAQTADQHPRNLAPSPAGRPRCSRAAATSSSSNPDQIDPSERRVVTDDTTFAVPGPAHSRACGDDLPRFDAPHRRFVRALAPTCCHLVGGRSIHRPAPNCRYSGDRGRLAGAALFRVEGPRRALIHVILRRRGLAPRFVPPISLVLATWASDYIAGLTAYRHVGASDHPERSTGAGTWLRTFATAAHRSCADAETYASRINALDAQWREQLGRVRANSAIELLLDLLPGVPVITVESAARLIGRSEMRTGEAVNRLETAGILRQRNIGRQRYRVFEAADVVDLFTGLERALASPTGDTVAAAPIRRVPRRVQPAGDEA